MNLYLSTELERKRNLITKLFPPIIETNQSTIKKLLSAKPYTGQDIAAAVRFLLADYQHHYDEQFVLLESIDQFGEVFQKVSNKTDKPIFVIYGKSENLWALCVIQHSSEGLKILYNDSCTHTMDVELKMAIEEKLDDVEFVNNTNGFLQKEHTYGHGPICLRNLKIVLESLQQDPENFVTNFKEIEFLKVGQLYNCKLTLLMQLTSALAKKKKFLTKLRRFMARLPTKRSSMHYVSEEELSFEAVKFDIEEIFPKEFQNLEKVLQIIRDIPENPKRILILDAVGDLLGLDSSKMLLWCEDEMEKESVQNEDANSVDGSIEQLQAIEKIPQILDKLYWIKTILSGRRS